MFLSGLDEIDQKIAALLIHNARMSYSDIGEAVGLSRVAVKSRIQALEERGVIEEYTTVINPQKITGAISCYFEIEMKPDDQPEIIKILEADDTVTQIYQVSGKCKLHVHAVAAGHEEMEIFFKKCYVPAAGCHRPELQRYSIQNKGYQRASVIRYTHSHEIQRFIGYRATRRIYAGRL